MPRFKMKRLRSDQRERIQRVRGHEMGANTDTGGGVEMWTQEGL